MAEARGRFLPFRMPESWSGRVFGLDRDAQGAPQMATKQAPHDGEYLVDGTYYWFAEGDPLPDGADAVAAPKPKKGKKGAPETPEGAGVTIETPEDGTQPETPE